MLLCKALPLLHGQKYTSLAQVAVPADGPWASGWGGREAGGDSVKRKKPGRSQEGRESLSGGGKGERHTGYRCVRGGIKGRLTTIQRIHKFQTMIEGSAGDDDKWEGRRRMERESEHLPIAATLNLT